MMAAEVEGAALTRRLSVAVAVTGSGTAVGGTGATGATGATVGNGEGGTLATAVGVAVLLLVAVGVGAVGGNR